MDDPPTPRRRSAVALFAATLATITLAGATAAQDPGSPIKAEAGPQESPGENGNPCVLLRNDQVVFGTAEQQGDWVVVRNGQGNRVRLRRSQVACWADSPRHLFQYRLDHRRPGDPAVHVRDARWCLRYGLLDLAAEELIALRRIVPDHPEATVIENQLRSAHARSHPRAEPDRPHAKPDSGVATVGFDQEVPPEKDAESPEDLDAGVSAESFHEFVRHVQPLLINRCGGCHTHTSDLDWQLVVLSRHRRPTARLSRQNLSAALELVRPGDPDASELLELATSPHAGGPPPLSAADESSINALRRWIRNAHPTSSGTSVPQSPATTLGPFATEQAVPSPGGTFDVNSGPVDGNATASHLVPGVSPAAFDAAPNHAAPPNAAPFEAAPFEAAPFEAAPFDAADTAVAREHPNAKPNPNLKRPSRLPAVQNPFDPALFNRRYHRP